VFSSTMFSYVFLSESEDESVGGFALLVSLSTSPNRLRAYLLCVYVLSHIQNNVSESH